MQMVRLVYASQVSEGADMKAVLQIAQSSREHNMESGITGLLCYDPGFFLQWIEGPRDTVNELYNKIVGDSRHLNVTLLAYAEVDERCFTTWSMAYVSMRDVDATLLRKYSARGAFDPFKMSSGAAQRFLQDLASSPEAPISST